MPIERLVEKNTMSSPSTPNTRLNALASRLKGSEKTWFTALSSEAAAPTGKTPALPQDLFRADESESRTLVLRSQGPTQISEGAALPSQVRFSDFVSDSSTLPPELRSLFSGPAEFQQDALAQLVVSRTSHGVLVHVPAGVQVRVPLRGLAWIDGTSPTLFHRTILVAEAGSEVAYVDEFAGSSDLLETSPQQNAAGLVQIIAKAGSKVSYFQVQNWPLNVRFGLRTAIHLERDAQVDLVSVHLGSAQG